MRSWIPDMSAPPGAVMTVQLRKNGEPEGASFGRQRSASPAKAIGAPSARVK